MADTKITALAAITTVDPAADVLPIVDISDTSMAASGTTKKITSNQILGSGGTATLASATITGDLTVDTSTLKVDSANNRVGIGTASPTNLLTIGTGAYAAAASGTTGMYTTASGLEMLSDSYFFGSRAGGGLMTLNSSGNVGIGVTPSAWVSMFKALNVSSYAAFGGNSDDKLTLVGNNYYNDGTAKFIGNGYAGAYSIYQGAHRWQISTTNNSSGAGANLTFTQAMTLDASGNLLVGKTAVSDLTVGFQTTQSGVVGSTRASSVDTESTYFVYSTGAAAYRFYVGMAGTVFATNTTISGISDARFKENVQDIDVGLGAILALKPRKFDWKAGKGKDIKGDRGFIAQEFEQVFPNLIDEWKDTAPEGEAPYKSVRQDLIPVLVKAIQELTARVQTLETR